MYDAARDRLIARLSECASDITALQALLKPIKTADAVPAGAELEAVAARLKGLHARLPQMDAALADSPQLDAVAAEDIDRLRRAIDAAIRKAAPLARSRRPGGAPAVAMAARAVSTELDEASDAILDLTGPYYVREQLRCLRVGRPLDVAIVFEDQPTPTVARLNELLVHLERDSCYLDEGVVDVGKQVIWRKSSSRTLRVLSYFSPIAVAILGAGALWLLTRLGVDASLDENSADEILKGYVLVLGGMAAHLAVENVKQLQAGTVQILAIGNFLDWLHLRWAGLAVSFVPVLVTVIGVRTGVDPDGKDMLIYLFAGYSIDSFAGVFLTRFGVTATTGAAGLKKLIAATGGEVAS